MASANDPNVRVDSVRKDIIIGNSKGSTSKEVDNNVCDSEVGASHVVPNEQNTVLSDADDISVASCSNSQDASPNALLKDVNSNVLKGERFSKKSRALKFTNEGTTRGRGRPGRGRPVGRGRKRGRPRMHPVLEDDSSICEVNPEPAVPGSTNLGTINYIVPLARKINFDFMNHMKRADIVTAPNKILAQKLGVVMFLGLGRSMCLEHFVNLQMLRRDDTLIDHHLAKIAATAVVTKDHPNISCFMLPAASPELLTYGHKNGFVTHTYTDLVLRKGNKNSSPKDTITPKNHQAPTSCEKQGRKRRMRIPPTDGSLIKKNFENILRSWESNDIGRRKSYVQRSPIVVLQDGHFNRNTVYCAVHLTNKCQCLQKRIMRKRTKKRVVSTDQKEGSCTSLEGESFTNLERVGFAGFTNDSTEMNSSGIRISDVRSLNDQGLDNEDLHCNELMPSRSPLVCDNTLQPVEEDSDRYKFFCLILTNVFDHLKFVRDNKTSCGASNDEVVIPFSVLKNMVLESRKKNDCTFQALNKENYEIKLPFGFYAYKSNTIYVGPYGLSEYHHLRAIKWKYNKSEDDENGPGGQQVACLIPFIHPEYPSIVPTSITSYWWFLDGIEAVNSQQVFDAIRRRYQTTQNTTDMIGNSQDVEFPVTLPCNNKSVSMLPSRSDGNKTAGSAPRMLANSGTSNRIQMVSVLKTNQTKVGSQSVLTSDANQPKRNNISANDFQHESTNKEIVQVEAPHTLHITDALSAKNMTSENNDLPENSAKNMASEKNDLTENSAKNIMTSEKNDLTENSAKNMASEKNDLTENSAKNIMTSEKNDLTENSAKNMASEKNDLTENSAKNMASEKNDLTENSAKNIMTSEKNDLTENSAKNMASEKNDLTEDSAKNMASEKNDLTENSAKNIMTSEKNDLTENSAKNMASEKNDLTENSAKNMTSEKNDLTEHSAKNMASEKNDLTENSAKNMTSEKNDLAENSAKMTSEKNDLAENSAKNMASEKNDLTNNSAKNITSEKNGLAENSAKNMTSEKNDLTENSAKNIMTSEKNYLTENSAKNMASEKNDLTENSAKNIMASEKNDLTENSAKNIMTSEKNDSDSMQAMHSNDLSQTCSNTGNSTTVIENVIRNAKENEVVEGTAAASSCSGSTSENCNDESTTALPVEPTGNTVSIPTGTPDLTNTETACSEDTNEQDHCSTSDIPVAAESAETSDNCVSENDVIQTDISAKCPVDSTPATCSGDLATANLIANTPCTSATITSPMTKSGIVKCSVGSDNSCVELTSSDSETEDEDLTKPVFRTSRNQLQEANSFLKIAISPRGGHLQ